VSAVLSTLSGDVRFALRGLAKHRTFTATAVLSLSLGIGVNTGIFTVLRALLLQPLPYPHADRLVILWNASPGLNITQDWFSTAQYFDIKDSATAFDEVAVAIGANYNLAGDGVEPERIGCIRTSSNLLPLLGGGLVAGRLFEPDDDVPGRAGTAILSHGTWTRRYGGDPAVIGRTIRLNDQPYQIVGVLNGGFALPRDVMPTLGVAEAGEIFLPLPLSPAARTTRTAEDYNIIARLKPGVSVNTARKEMDVLTARLRTDFPDVYPPNGGLTFDVVPLLEQVVGSLRRPLWILLGAVGFVLLIACANVANLMLARALARQNEFAVRIALGASRGRIAVQLLAESVALAALGACGGLLLAAAAVGGLRSLQPANLPRLSDISIDGAVLAFTIGVSLVTAILFGLAPALGAGRLGVSGAMNTSARGSTAAGGFGTKRLNYRFALVVGELSLSLVLLVGAGLLIRSFAKLQNVAPGFDRRGVLSFELMMAGRRYTDPQAVRNAYQRLWTELDRLPGVVASGGVTSLPLSGFFAWGPITIEGRTPPAGEKFINADQRVVSGRYFEAMGIPLERGRLFDAGDTADKPRVAIVDARMAEEFWPGGDPIGKRIRNGDIRSTAPWITIVGVVGRVKQYALDSDSRIAFYVPQLQGTGRSLYVVVKSRADPAALTQAAAQAVRAIDPDLPIYHVQTVDAIVRRSMSVQQFATLLLTLFAATALVLALIGISGVMSYLVSRSARDLGIRMALGATHHMIVTWVLRHAVVVTLAGIALGLGVAALLARVMRGLVFGVEPTDAATFAAVTLLLVSAALVASYLPARRATRIDPLTSLRAE
jgi:predicted permease